MASPTLGAEYRYAALPLAVADTIFSIGVRYEGTRRTVARLAQALHLDPHVASTAVWPLPRARQVTVRQALAFLGTWPRSLHAERVYGNAQRTCARTTAPHKAVIVNDALRLLAAHGIDTVQDAQAALAQPVRADALEAAWRALPGQSSGISWRYLGMLVGAAAQVKPDRMVIRFLSNALAASSPRSRRDLVPGTGLLDPEDAGLLLQAVAEQLARRYASRRGLTPRALDYAVWSFQRQVALR
jgi:hypothetical protein